MKKFICALIILLFTLTSIISCNSIENLLKIHYIDVGQGDAILIEYKSQNLLIDSGPNTSQDKLNKYLKKNNIKTINYLLATHPHEDHIGNMDFLIENFSVKTFLMPKVIYESSDFTNLIKSLKKNNLDITIIDTTTEENINLGDNIQFEIFSSTTKHENLNNYSPIIKLTHYDTSFLFTGDAEEEAETQVLMKNIDSDVLKIGHHGSSTSSTLPFLEKVKPDISIISCGINNDFNHPHKSTINNLKSINSQVYRTDEDGTIVLVSNGRTIIKK